MGLAGWHMRQTDAPPASDCHVSTSPSQLSLNRALSCEERGGNTTNLLSITTTRTQGLQALGQRGYSHTDIQSQPLCPRMHYRQSGRVAATALPKVVHSNHKRKQKQDSKHHHKTNCAKFGQVTKPAVALLQSRQRRWQERASPRLWG